MSEFWSPFVHGLVPYVPGEQPKLAKLVKLNTNENPYGPSPAVLDAVRAATNEDLRRYPDPNADALKQAVAGYYAVPVDHVFVGNGSDEVLAHAFMGFFQHDKPILFADITYSFYKVYCGLYGIDYECVPLDEKYEINIAAYARPNGGIIVANPNAPTGCLLSLASIETLLQANTQSLVLVDEAYIDFGGETAIGLVSRYPNLLVTQTLSKSRSLAGLRIGFAVGQPHLIEALERIKNSFNSYPLDRLAIAAGVAAFRDEDYFQQTRLAVMAGRDAVVSGLQALGFSVLPSAANFVLAQHAVQPAAALASALREQGIIVRYFNAPRIDNFLRITIGKPEENAELLQALQVIVGNR